MRLPARSVTGYTRPWFGVPFGQVSVACPPKNSLKFPCFWSAVGRVFSTVNTGFVNTLPLLLERSRKGVHKAGVDRAVIIETVHVEKPECFAPLGYLGYRPAHGCAPVILGERKLLVSNFSSEKEVSRVQLIVAEKIV